VWDWLNLRTNRGSWPAWMAYVRTVRTTSAATAVQIVHGGTGGTQHELLPQHQRRPGAVPRDSGEPPQVAELIGSDQDGKIMHVYYPVRRCTGRGGWLEQAASPVRGPGLGLGCSDGVGEVARSKSSVAPGRQAAKFVRRRGRYRPDSAAVAGCETAGAG